MVACFLDKADPISVSVIGQSQAGDKNANLGNIYGCRVSDTLIPPHLGAKRQKFHRWKASVDHSETESPTKPSMTLDSNSVEHVRRTRIILQYNAVKKLRIQHTIRMECGDHDVGQKAESSAHESLDNQCGPGRNNQLCVALDLPPLKL